MRIAVSDLSEKSLQELRQGLRIVSQSPLSTQVSGFISAIPKAKEMLNPTCTFISRIESWCLNLSSRGARWLSASYWIFTALSCIMFFTSHWSIFLAFLIPALVMNHMRLVRQVSKKHSDYHCGLSTSGT